MSKALEETFRQAVILCAEKGEIITLPTVLDKEICGNIMAEEAGRFIDEGQDAKAMLILLERKRLGV